MILAILWDGMDSKSTRTRPSPIIWEKVEESTIRFFQIIFLVASTLIIASFNGARVHAGTGFVV